MSDKLWRVIIYSLAAFMMIFFIASCAPTKRVSRIDVTEIRDLSGRWNDTDSRLVSEEMIADCLNRPWVDNFIQKNGKQPDVIVGRIRNKSHEHINVQTFVKDLERALTNSGKVFFVASEAERQDIRQERLDMDIHASEESRKAFGEEAGADYMLSGTINTILDEEGSERVMFYQVDLEMADMTTNRKVWYGQKKIKKFIEKKRFGW